MRTDEDVKLRPIPGDVLRKVKPRCVNVGNWKARALEAERERDEMDKIRQQHIAVEAQWLLVRLERDRFERELTEARATSQRQAVEIEELRRALGFYANPDSHTNKYGGYNYNDGTPVNVDRGEKARAAMKEKPGSPATEATTKKSLEVQL